MVKFKFILKILLPIISLSCFSSFSFSTKCEQNIKNLSNIFTGLVNQERSNNEKLKSFNLLKNEPFEIENNEEMLDIFSESNMNFEDTFGCVYDRQFNFIENSATATIGDSYISILNFESFDYSLNQENVLDSYDKTYCHIKRANNSVSFTGINVNPSTCVWVTEKMTNFAEKTVGKYSGIAGIVYNAVKLLAPTFVAQFTTFLVGIINQFTDWLASIGPWGIVIKLVLILFSAIAAVIIANIIWAGSNHKGFRMGLEWIGLFRTRWVYDFYD